MAAGRIKPPVSITVLIVFGAILVSLHLMSSATQDPTGLGEMYSWLLLINTLGSLLLLVLVAANIHAVVRQVRKRKAGSRLTLRMVFLFVLLSMAPASIVFYYSMQFLHQGIDSWFDVQIDQAMEDALELSQAALDQRMGYLLKETNKMAEQLFSTPDSLATIDLEELRKQSSAIELTLLTKNGRIIASNSAYPELIVPSLPADSILSQLKHGKPYVGLDSLGDEMSIRALVAVGPEKSRYLHALFPVPLRVRALANAVESAYGRYKEMNYLRDSLKTSFSLTLSLVLLLSLLAAIWVAFISIRRIVAPVRDLALGTMAVGAGDYGQRIPVMSQDEWGFLVESFNEMTERLAQTRDEADRSRTEVENQRSYLESVLGNLTSGVLSFDARFRIRTANQAADKILGIEFTDYIGKRLSVLSTDYPNLENLVDVLQHRLEQAQTMWRNEIAFMGRNGRQELICRGAPIFSSYGHRTGAVMVFDDMTDLIRAQRNAAWGEVAQRLAHEIKNPLTPIQLSAERIKLKLGEKLEPKDARMLDRATDTIVQQVEAMKTMVNAFSAYARPPKRRLKKLNLNALVLEVLTLYPSHSGLCLKKSLDEYLPEIDADPIRMRQVLHNLIKNTKEALESVADASLLISSRRVRKLGSNYVELSIEDNGPGIPLDQIDRVFEPYVTNKVKGTGLGLAIVKKIIEEHGGIIFFDSEYKSGARVVMRLPLVESSVAFETVEGANESG